MKEKNKRAASEALPRNHRRNFIMATVEITAENFASEVENAQGKVLVDFWASWCGPCRMLSPIVDQVASEHTDVKVGKVNVDEQPKLAEKFQIMSIPTLLVFENGKLTNQSVGLVPKEQVEALLG
ncbi:MAG: thioredoxin [Veillonellaceae bacterium]|nr:thioredoxin [Veillonellaceae bacterium]MDD6698882.1 thioredoxin [Veillonellaceae bacterium]